MSSPAEPDVLLVTCAEFPEGDEDGPQIVTALDRVGVLAQWRSWNDASAPCATTPTVLRAAWDYTFRRAEFLTWARAVPVLHNPYAVVVWNSDKRYLLELAAADIAITPTTVRELGDTTPVEIDGEVVVKPSVGAGSRGAGRFTDPRAASAHVAALHTEGRTALVQPYLGAVDTVGETALIYLDGSYSHAIRKGALLESDVAHAVLGEGLYLPESISARSASDTERAVGDAAIAFLTERFGSLLYARIDLLPGPDGPVVVEVEVVEPSLFLGFGAGAVDRFAAAVAARLP